MATKATDYDIVGSYDNQRITSISAQRTVNMFEYIDTEGKRPKVLLPTSGLINANLNLTSSNLGARAAFVFNGAVYQVYGNTVFKTIGPTTALITTPIGTLSNSSGYVGVDANTFQVIFVDGNQGFIYDTSTSVFARITDPSFPAKPIDVTYLDGFFVVAHGITNQFQLSEFNQGLIWGPDYTSGTGNSWIAVGGGSPNITLASGSTLYYQTGTPIQFNGGGTLPNGTPPIAFDTTYYVKDVIDPTTFTISATLGGAAITFSTTGVAPLFVSNNGQLQLGSITTHPGTIVACKTLHRRLFLFSQNFTEVWENAGAGTNLPFRRNNSLLMEIGTPATGSVSVGFDRMFFLSQDKDGLAGVVEVKGTESLPVSNRALDYQLAQYAADPDTGVSDARGILIKENGLIFYRLNFTAANHTFVLNVSMSMQDSPKWHEEEVLNGDRHPAQTHFYYQGVNYYGDYSQATTYIVDPMHSTNNGEAIKRMRIGRQISPDGYNRLRIDRFQLDLLQGQLELMFGVSEPILTESNQDLLTEDDEIISTEEPYMMINEQPQVFLSYSKDGGQTYGNHLIAYMGKIGQRTYRTVWRKLGTTPRGQGFTPRIEFFNDYPFIILGAAWAFEILPE
jgi:hypothetical protein